MNFLTVIDKPMSQVTEAEIQAAYLPYQLLFVAMVVAYIALTYYQACKIVRKTTYGDRDKASFSEVLLLMLVHHVAYKTAKEVLVKKNDR